MRSQFNGDKDGTETAAGELDVQVQIEQAVMVDYEYGREDYRKPGAIWRQSTKDNEVQSEDQNQWELSSVKSSKTVDAV